jgi:SAM-dependent MidA family methyltransferase
LFGALVARWIDAEWQRVGAPDDFTIVEFGAGPGTLARAVLAASPRWRDRYVAVELSDQQRQRHPDVVSVPEITGPYEGSGVVIANELLDNLPFRLAVFDGGWREVTVGVGADDRFVEHTVAPDATWDWLPSIAPHGARVPIQRDAARWVEAAQSLFRQGTVISFDYCTPSTAELSRLPWREWLRTYRSHGRGEHYLRVPGEQDITAQVCIDQLPSPQVTEPQAAFLRRLGVDQLVDEGRSAWSAAAARPDLAAMTMRSRAREAEALLDPDGLGAFTVASWQVAHSSDRSA